MTPDSGITGRLSRRSFLRVAGAAALAGAGLVASAPRGRALTINPRSSWAIDRPPLGPLPGEDVQFLLVHHSASQNGHTAAEVPAILRGFYDYHTSAEKGWNDIAYNFLIDGFGGIWEGREGSISGSVAGDATGGNQGYSQLVCLIGDYNEIQPAPASIASLTSLLAWMADKHGVATSPGSEVTFVSKGSNLWPEGASVTTPTINGHRAMSSTTCPGDNVFAIVAGSLMADVTAVRGEAAATAATPAPTNPTTVPETATTVAPTTTVSDPVPTTAPTTVATSAVRAQVVAPSSTIPEVTLAAEPVTPMKAGSRSPLVWTAAGLGAAATAGLAWRYRRMEK